MTEQLQFDFMKAEDKIRKLPQLEEAFPSIDDLGMTGNSETLYISRKVYEKQMQLEVYYQRQLQNRIVNLADDRDSLLFEVKSVDAIMPLLDKIVNTDNVTEKEYKKVRTFISEWF